MAASLADDTQDSMQKESKIAALCIFAPERNRFTVSLQFSSCYFGCEEILRIFTV